VFKLFSITDNFGTKQKAYTMAGATKWLAYCGDVATIQNRLTHKIVVQRIQGNVGANINKLTSYQGK